MMNYEFVYLANVLLSSFVASHSCTFGNTTRLYKFGIDEFNELKALGSTSLIILNSEFIIPK
jgi:hypothetical protein